jgi:hypothetical protein
MAIVVLAPYQCEAFANLGRRYAIEKPKVSSIKISAQRASSPNPFHPKKQTKTKGHYLHKPASIFAHLISIQQQVKEKPMMLIAREYGGEKGYGIWAG